MISPIFASMTSSFKEFFRSSRAIIVLTLMILVIWVNLTPLYAASDTTGYRINPLLLTFIVDEPVNQLFLMIGAIIMFADAPFANSNQVLVLLRSGRLSWFAGKVLFIVALSILYWMLANLLVLIFLLPCATFATDGWGVIVNTMAQTNAGIQFDLRFSFDTYTIQTMSPFGALAISTTMEILATIVLAFTITIVNVATSTKVGIGVAIFWLLLDLLVVNLLPYSTFLFSVASHGRLIIFSDRGPFMPSISQTTCFDILAIVALVGIATVLFCKKDVSVQDDT